MDFPSILEDILGHHDLSRQAAEELMRETMVGKLSPAQIAAYLVALRLKGETADEIAGFAQAMRQSAVKLPRKKSPLVDTCGTGGDRSHWLNISTLAALTLASVGVPVAKHGNRAISSQTGSADFLESLGYPLEESPESAAERLQQTNFCFLFAPKYHPAMKHVAPVRKELGIRTVFNILGPLANPAGAEIQLLGVADEKRLWDMAKALQELGVHKALVVHGSGVDEIHPIMPTKYLKVDRNHISEGLLDPRELGLRPLSLEEIVARSRQEALAKSQDFLDGKNETAITTVALNAAAALYLYEEEVSGKSLPLQDYLKTKVAELQAYLKKGPLGEFIKNAFRPF
ncbi:MAG: anthranilate phosphoribosyltransferase [Leptospiraceae bacterium]|nr:anthranilate phosphoribosyltransferase [Leptospiraceae bacterium]MDW8306752.1 anthranilate phosphoribosyltransferase [Leptospiraceae bacterium]